MIVQAPCRLGERFRIDKPAKREHPVTLVYLSFFNWSLGTMPGTSYGYKYDPRNEQENTGWAIPGDEVGGVKIQVELETEAIEPGYPLRKLGLDTDAVGRLCGIRWTPEGWSYYISRGKSYGERLELVQSDLLDKLFADLLPLHAVRLNPMDYLA